MLSNPLALTAAFIAGSGSGALLTYLREKHGLTKVSRLPKITVSPANQPAGCDARFVMKALVIARDPEMVGILSDAFRKKRISTQQCSSEKAVEQLSSEKFAAVVLDFDQLPGCDHVLQNLPGANKRVVVIAVASDTVAKAIASRLGASFILERPLDPERLRNLVTSAYGRMLRDSQVYFRLAVELRVSLRRSDGKLLQCTTLNVSQTGMAINTPAVFTVGEAIQLAFAIPNTDIFVSADGKVIWDDKHGKAGISFECASSSADKAFHDWLHDHFHMNLETKSASDAQQVASDNPPDVARLLWSLLCILSLSTWLCGATSAGTENAAIHLSGHVRDRQTGKAIEAARVKVLPSTDNAIWGTDGKGEFSFWLAKQEVNRVEIEAPGYRTVSLAPMTGALGDVQLIRESADGSTPSFVNGTNASPLMPISQAVAPAIMTADSGPRPSGRGSRWSPWYRIGVTRAPAGYAVSRVEFWLSGDGACGRSAECRQLGSNDEQVMWEFRLHGHKEIGAPSQTFSVAHIRVIFRPR